MSNKIETFWTPFRTTWDLRIELGPTTLDGPVETSQKTNLGLFTNEFHPLSQIVKTKVLRTLMKNINRVWS